MGLAARGAWLATAAALFVQPARSQAPPRDAIIQGSVFDASTGRGISGARVRIQSDKDEPLVTATDAKGHFRFTGLEYKPYQVDARYPGFTTTKEAINEYGGETVSPMRNPPDGQVRLELQRYAVIVGKVVDAVGVGVEGVAVHALQRYPSGERHRSAYYHDGGYEYAGTQQTITNDLGEYRIAPLTAGSYYVFVEQEFAYYQGQSPRPQPDPRERPTFYPHALKPSDTKPVELAGGKELRVDVQIVRQGGVKLSGRVLGTEPASPAHVIVTVSPLSPGASSAQFRDTVGDRFTAADLLPGKYLIEALQYAADDSRHQNPLATAQRTVEVGAQDVDGIDLTVVPAHDVEAAVVFDGCPAIPVWIQLQADRWVRQLPPRNLHVGAEGRFVLPHLAPAKYTIYVEPEDRSRPLAASARLGDTAAQSGGFDATLENSAPLRITVSCAGR